ncbi:nuclear pore complex protein NUP1-like [Rhododendron vialii]|uniref:nuclear pore complex protein NUP1-like n=1 Tax=Rhododendron vialii TaxID=182163 RepID=UPI00265D7417|nr:nuclear pore complex protein NUP1-like [Rhododendron vialii]
MPFRFGSSASSTISGTTETPSLRSSTSPFGSSTSSGSPFGLPAPKPIGSSSGFGPSSLATNSNSSSSPTSSLLSSTRQPPKSSIFSSTTESPATVFSFGASSVSAAAANSAPMVFGSSSGSLFSFTSAAAASASSFQTLPVFSSGDQMNMEDSVDEDQPIQASTPTVPVFGQTPISNPSSGFVFSPAVPSAGNPFQFGGLQNQSTPQNPSPFQTSGSLDFAAAGNSFFLGSTSDDKANRMIVRVKHKPQRSSAVPSAGNPFQFGSQQNQSTPQNPSPFQTSGSLDFATACNSFLLGSTGDDEANRRIVRVKHKPRRR